MHIAASGLINISIGELLSTPIQHLDSGVDLDDRLEVGGCGAPTFISGCTEWLSVEDLVITIGWDWYINTATSLPCWTRLGLPRSNIVLVSDASDSASWTRNLKIIATVVDVLPWREQTAVAVSARYSWRQSPE